MKCPKCGRKTAKANELALWCTSCDWEVIDPGPLFDETRIRSRRKNGR